MSRREQQRLADILVAVDEIRSHLARGDLSDGLVFDAVRMRLIEIGEAVKDLPTAMRSGESGIPWKAIAAMRDQLAHSYFDTSHSIVEATVGADLVELEAAVRRLALRDSDEA